MPCPNVMGRFTQYALSSMHRFTRRKQQLIALSVFSGICHDENQKKDKILIASAQSRTICHDEPLLTRKKIMLFQTNYGHGYKIMALGRFDGKSYRS